MNLKNLMMWGVIVLLVVGLFNLFQNPGEENHKEGKELIMANPSLLEEPFTKIGMFTKLIINHHICAG